MQSFTILRARVSSQVEQLHLLGADVLEQRLGIDFDTMAASAGAQRLQGQSGRVYAVPASAAKHVAQSMRLLLEPRGVRVAIA